MARPLRGGGGKGQAIEEKKKKNDTFWRLKEVSMTIKHLYPYKMKVINKPNLTNDVSFEKKGSRKKQFLP